MEYLHRYVNDRFLGMKPLPDSMVGVGKGLGLLRGRL